MENSCSDNLDFSIDSNNVFDSNKHNNYSSDLFNSSPYSQPTLNEISPTNSYDYADQNHSVYPQSQDDELFGSLSPFSPITQLDGNDTLPSVISSSPVTTRGASQLIRDINNLDHADNHSFGQIKTNNKASFSMNKGKQLKKLCLDTEILDVSIEVSPSLKNVNIKCSTGYYFQVVAPAVRGLDVGCEIDVSKIKVKCVDKVGKVDAEGSGLNTRFKFILFDEQKFVGSVTMHLHHTTRLVQVQGSSILPDKSLAPIWFVQNFMQHILSPLAATKSDEVSLFNNLVKTSYG